MCGRLRVGKENLHVASLVGVAMCSACLRGSHEPQAPALRRIGRRVPLERLEAQLGVGLLGGHPAMPKFTFEPRDVTAIMRYLRSIQEP